MRRSFIECLKLKSLAPKKNFMYVCKVKFKLIPVKSQTGSHLLLYFGPLFCVGFLDLFHLTHDLSQDEKKINVVTS